MNSDRGNHEYEGDDLAYVGVHKHVCCFYKTNGEFEQQWLPFVVEGLKQRQKCIIVVGDDYGVEEAEYALIRAGVDTKKHFADASLVIVDNTGFPTAPDVHPDEVIAYWKLKLGEACDEGFSSVRSVVQMTWLGSAQRELELVPEYEFLCNKLFPNMPMSALCMYDRRIFSQSQIDRVTAAHPYVAEKRPTGQMASPSQFLLQHVSGPACHTASELLQSGSYKNAEQLFREAVEIEEGLKKVSAMLGLIQCLRAQDRILEADKLEEQATNLLLKR